MRKVALNHNDMSRKNPKYSMKIHEIFLDGVHINTFKIEKYLFLCLFAGDTSVPLTVVIDLGNTEGITFHPAYGHGSNYEQQCAEGLSLGNTFFYKTCWKEYLLFISKSPA